MVENFKNSKNIHLLFVSKIRTMQGDSHVFKTSSRQYQVCRIRAISKEIVKNHENIFSEMAEFIISDEQEARSRCAEEVTCDFLKVKKIPRHHGKDMDLTSKVTPAIPTQLNISYNEGSSDWDLDELWRCTLAEYSISCCFHHAWYSIWCHVEYTKCFLSTYPHARRFFIPTW